MLFLCNANIFVYVGFQYSHTCSIHILQYIEKY